MYKDKYQREFFGDVIVGATQELMNHIWGHTKTEREEGCKAWINTVSEHLGVIKPQFKFVEGVDAVQLYKDYGGGLYNPEGTDETGAIVGCIYMFKKFSLTTLLHEYRHHLQKVQALGNAPTSVEAVEAVLTGNTPFDPEEDAREWSCSLYFVSDPDRYMRAVTAGKLRYA